MDNINALPTVHRSQPSKIHQFCQTLKYNVQSLETLGKLSDCLSMVRGVLDKLPGIKAEIVSNKMGWQDWGFGELLQALEEWKEVHPLEMVQNNTSPPLRLPRVKTFHSQDKDPARQVCVYCDCVTHRSWECDKITSLADRRQILQNKKLCFDYTGSKHHAPQCRSRGTCVHCKQRHHSSICDKGEGRGQQTDNGGVALTSVSRRGESMPPCFLGESEWHNLPSSS